MKNTFVVRKFPLVLVVLLAVAIATLALALGQTHRTAAAGDCTIGTNEIALDASEQDMLTQINSYRRGNGLSDLTPSPTLNRAAAWLARDMAQRRVMSHTDSLGRGLDRLADCGYRYYPAGENVAYGTGSYGTTPSILNGWKNSPGHNANMLNSSYKAVGVGMSCVGNACYWALDLGGVVDGSVATNPTVPSVPTAATPTATVTSPGYTNYTYYPQYSNPVYYTNQTIPSSLQSSLANKTYWVYSNGRWYGYTPQVTSGSDRYLSGLSGFYYFFYR